MKIIAAVRTRNEERNIEKFCLSYQWTDKILVADGGSTDKTVDIASNIPKAEVRDFPVKRKMLDGLWRNPEAEHINFLIDWANEENADWIIFDDCDCIPNYKLRDEARELLEMSSKDFVFVVRLYLIGKDKHIEKLAKPGKDGEYETSLWAWKTNPGIRFEDTKMGFMFRPLPKLDERVNLYPPYCLLHNSWPTEEAIQQKLDFYRRSGQIPGALHPSEMGAATPLPEWAHE